MNVPKWEIVSVHQVWNNKSGERIEVGPDMDGLDLCEIRLRTPDGGIGSSITFTEEALPHVIQALQKLQKDLSEKSPVD